jgi:hypothetical protein
MIEHCHKPYSALPHPANDARSRNELPKAKNRNRTRVQAKIEHVFGAMKNIFGSTPC